MAVELPGNAIPAPGYRRGNVSVDTEIMYDMAGYTQKGVTLTAGQGILPAGTVLGRVTATKKWSVYNNALSNGVEVARGVLRQAVDTGTDADADSFQGNIVIQGILKLDKVSGADSAAITDLNARTDTVLNTFTF